MYGNRENNIKTLNTLFGTIHTPIAIKGLTLINFSRSSGFYLWFSMAQCDVRLLHGYKIQMSIYLLMIPMWTINKKINSMRIMSSEGLATIEACGPLLNSHKLIRNN